MSTIFGVVNKRGGFVGLTADRQVSSNDGLKWNDVGGKMIRIPIEFRIDPNRPLDDHPLTVVVGATGSPLIIQICRQLIFEYRDGVVSSPGLFMEVCEDIAQRVKKEMIVRDVLFKLQEDGFRMLIGGMGMLAVVYKDFSMAFSDTYAAIGSQADVALGVLALNHYLENEQSDNLRPKLSYRELHECIAKHSAWTSVECDTMMVDSKRPEHILE